MALDSRCFFFFFVMFKLFGFLFVLAKQLALVWNNNLMAKQWPLFGNYFGTPKLKSIFNVFLNFNCKLTMLLFNGMHGLEVK